MKKQLKSDWYTVDRGPSVDLSEAGIYQWSIEGTGVYIGKAKVLRKRILAYPRNVRRMLEGKPWHGNPEKNYREIHHALRQAHDAGTPVIVSVLEVCDPTIRSERERCWIKLRSRQETEQQGPRVLNSD